MEKFLPVKRYVLVYVYVIFCTYGYLFEPRESKLVKEAINELRATSFADFMQVFVDQKRFTVKVSLQSFAKLPSGTFAILKNDKVKFYSDCLKKENEKTKHFCDFYVPFPGQYSLTLWQFNVNENTQHNRPFNKFKYKHPITIKNLDLNNFNHPENLQNFKNVFGTLSNSFSSIRHVTGKYSFKNFLKDPNLQLFMLGVGSAGSLQNYYDTMVKELNSTIDRSKSRKSILKTSSISDPKTSFTAETFKISQKFRKTGQIYLIKSNCESIYNFLNTNSSNVLVVSPDQIIDSVESAYANLNSCLENILKSYDKAKIFIKTPEFNFVNQKNNNPLSSFKTRQLMFEQLSVIKSKFKYGKRIQIIDTWQQGWFSANDDKFSLNDQIKAALYGKFIPLICGDRCRSDSDTGMRFLEPVNGIGSLSLTSKSKTDWTRCQSCQTGTWTNCNQTRSKFSSNLMEFIRINKTPKMKQLKDHIISPSTQYCGKVNEHLCPPFPKEKSCCVNPFNQFEKCVDFKFCENSSFSQNNKQIDLNNFKYVDSCSWVPGEQTKNFGGTGRSLNFINQPDLLTWLNGDGSDSGSPPIKNIHIIGDSHARGIFITLMTILRNNTYSYPVNSYPGILSKCFGFYENFWHKKCQADFQRSIDLEDLGLKIYLNEAWDDKSFEKVLKKIDLNKNHFEEEEGTLIIFEQGLHQDFDSKTIIEMLNKLLVSLTQKTAHKIIFTTPPLASFIKPFEYWKNQGNNRQRKFSKEIKQFLSGQNFIKFFDLADITENLHSFDGVHYFFNVYRLFWSLLVYQF